MSIVNAKEMIRKAYREGYAVPQFNVNGVYWTKAILEVCQEEQSPVILGVAMGAATAIGGYRTVVGMVRGLAEDLSIQVPVAIHLDHGSYDACLACVEAGFTSVMFDGSKLPIEENLQKTRALAVLCREKGVSLEAEVGTIGAHVSGGVKSGECADPAECERMSREDITMLAAGIGNIHGVYPPEWEGLNWEVLEAIRGRIGEMPLVLHGGSGIPADMLKKSIAQGVAKININTENQIAAMAAMRRYFEENKDRQEKGHFVRNLAADGVNAMKPILREKIRLFGCGEKA